MKAHPSPIEESAANPGNAADFINADLAGPKFTDGFRFSSYDLNIFMRLLSSGELRWRLRSERAGLCDVMPNVK